MAFREYKAVWFPTGSTTGVEIDNIISMKPTRTLNAKSNGVEIILDNYAGESVDTTEVKYKQDEVIKVYAAEGDVSTASSTHLIGTYVVLNHNITPDIRQIKLTCGDKTYNMLSKIFIGDETGTPPTIINTIVQRVNQDGSSSAQITTNIDSTKSDASAFPSVEYYSYNKTAYDCISELSQTDYTEDDRSYLFWFDENDEFHWTYPGQTVETDTFVYGEDPVNEMKIQKKEAESMAMIIYDAGLDKNNDTVLNFFVDPNAGSIKNRMKYFGWPKIADELRKKFQDAGTYTAMTNADFVTAVETAAEAKCRSIIQKSGTGLWEATISINGAKYTPGGLYKVKSEEHGFPQKNLRIERVDHTMDKNGWSTKLTLVEDEEAIE